MKRVWQRRRNANKRFLSEYHYLWTRKPNKRVYTAITLLRVVTLILSWVSYTIYLFVINSCMHVFTLYIIDRFIFTYCLLFYHLTCLYFRIQIKFSCLRNSKNEEPFRSNICFIAEKPMQRPAARPPGKRRGGSPSRPRAPPSRSRPRACPPRRPRRSPRRGSTWAAKELCA